MRDDAIDGDLDIDGDYSATEGDNGDNPPSQTAARRVTDETNLDATCTEHQSVPHVNGMMDRTKIVARGPNFHLTKRVLVTPKKTNKTQQ